MEINELNYSYINAESARAITRKGREQELEEILLRIVQSASEGNTEVEILGIPLRVDTVNELSERGFTVQSTSMHPERTEYLIKW